MFPIAYRHDRWRQEVFQFVVRLTKRRLSSTTSYQLFVTITYVPVSCDVEKQSTYAQSSWTAVFG